MLSYSFLPLPSPLKFSGSMLRQSLYMDCRTWKPTTTVSVSGEPNGYCMSAALAKIVRRGRSHRSDWGYHLSVNILGAPTLIFTTCFLPGLLFMLGIHLALLFSAISPGCMLGPVSWVSKNGGIVFISIIKSTSGCLKNHRVHPLYLQRSRSSLEAVQ